MTGKQRIASKTSLQSHAKSHPWSGFLPSRAVVMARHRPAEAVAAAQPASVPTPEIPAAEKLSPILVVFLSSPGNARTQALLDRMIQAMGLAPEQVLCVQEPTAIPAQSKMIVAFGEDSFQALTKSASADFNFQRGKFIPVSSAQVMPTHDLNRLLNVAEAKKDTWTDLQEVLKALGIALPKKGGR